MAPTIRRCALADLADADMGQAATLYVPPARPLQPDAEMFDRLGVARFPDSSDRMSRAGKLIRRQGSGSAGRPMTVGRPARSFVP